MQCQRPEVKDNLDASMKGAANVFDKQLVSIQSAALPGLQPPETGNEKMIGIMKRVTLESPGSNISLSAARLSSNDPNSPCEE